MFNLMPLKAVIQKQYGHKCDEAINGAIAVDMYCQSMTKTCCDVRYKCIFTDINMPEMDGITEAKQVIEHQKIFRKKNPSLPIVKIVIVSAYDSEQTQKQLASFGITDYLTKPVNVKDVPPILKVVFSDDNAKPVSQT